MNMPIALYFILPTEKMLCLPETSFQFLLARERRMCVGPQILQPLALTEMYPKKLTEQIWMHKEH